jgi:TP901 family phage tail tape measure protein
MSASRNQVPKKLPISAEFSAEDRLTGTVVRIEKRLGLFSRRTRRGFEKVRLSALDVAKGVASVQVAGAGIRTVTGAVFGFVGSAAQLGTAYEKTLDKVSAKIGDVKKGSVAYKALDEVAQKVGRDTEFSAVRAAEGLEYLAIAGFKATQAVAALPKVVDIATVADLGFAQSTDIVSDTLGAFNLMSKDTTVLMKNLSRVNDVMASTITSSNTSMEALFETFKEAGPIGTSFGASLETISAMAGKLADAGIKGTRAGTTLKNIFTSLSSPAPAKALAKIGVVITDKAGKFRDINAIFGDLQKGLEKLSDKQQMALLNKVFGKIPLAGVNVLLKTGAQNLDVFRDKLNASAGAANRMATQIRGNTAGSIAALKSKFDALKLQAFQAMLPVLSALVPKLSAIVDKTAAWAKENKQVITEGLMTGLRSIAAILNGIATAFNKVRQAGEYAAKGVLRVQKAWDWAKGKLDPVERMQRQMRQVGFEKSQRDYEAKQGLQQSKNVLMFLQRQLAQAAQAPRAGAPSVVTTKTMSRHVEEQRQKQTIDLNVNIDSGKTTIKRKRNSGRASGGINIRTGKTRAIAPAGAGA